jgi:hypothetical protein
VRIPATLNMKCFVMGCFTTLPLHTSQSADITDRPFSTYLHVIIYIIQFFFTY